MIRSLFIAIAMFVPFLKPWASELKNSASIGLDTYADNGDVEVYSPTFSLMKTISKEWLVGIKMRIDAIASASIRNGGRPGIPDAVAGASGRSDDFDDMRYAPTFLVAYDDGINSIGGGFYYSTEKDYEGRSLFAHYVRQLNEGNTALGISFSKASDTWDPVFDRTLPMSYRNEFKMDLSVNQLLTPDTSVQFVYSYIDSEGFLASPYHYVIQNDLARFERYPDRRKAHAFALKAMHYLDENNALNGSYRYYTDDWKIDSHTFELEWLHDLSDTLMVGLRGRYYTQTGSFFAKAIDGYINNDPYFAADYRMSAFKSYDIGVPVRYKTSQESPYTFSFSVDYYRTSDNAYIQRWYGKPSLEAFYTTIRVDFEF